MAMYVRIEAGAVQEHREFPDGPPTHKAGLWRLFVDGGAPTPAAGQSVSRSEAESGGNWAVSYSLVKRPDAELQALIKQEAQRRIIAAVGATSFEACLTKQLNAVMRATEITNKLAIGQVLSAEESAEAAALQAMADGIKALRAKSNLIEAALPIDFTADAHWQG